MIYLATLNNVEHLFYNTSDKHFYSCLNSSDRTIYAKLCDSIISIICGEFKYELPEKWIVIYCDYDERMFHCLNILEKLIFNKL